MSFTKGTVNAGTDAANANAIREAIVAALDAHPAWEHVETAVSGVRTLSVVKSLGALNGDGQDWYLLMLTGFATNSFYFNISSDYVPGSYTAREYINGPRHTTDVRDLFVSATPINMLTATWSTSNTSTAIYSGFGFVTSTAPYNWWVEVTSEYCIINGWFIGMVEVPEESLWRRHLAIFACQISTTSGGGGVLHGHYGSSTSGSGANLSTSLTSITPHAWLAKTLDRNFDEIPYSKIPLMSGFAFFGYMPNSLWIPYSTAFEDTATIEGEDYMNIGGWTWHKVGLA